MHLAPLIRDLAIILGVAGLVTVIFQWIRQPVVLGYIVAGIIVGPHTPPFPLISDIPNIQTLAELGVIFLMFTLGLEFSFRKLAKVGTSASFTAVFEVFFMLTVGYGTGQLLGWSKMDSIFLGAILSISSTTIIIKALDELGLKTKRFAELIFGILIVEDLVAILLLVALSTVAASGSFSGVLLLSSTLKLGLVVGTWFLGGYFLVPRFISYVARFRSDEMLTVLSLGLCLLLVVAAAYFHYSVALGAFIMGSILSESTSSHKIEELMKPLRDIFAAVFFVSVGMLMDPVSIWQHKGAIALITGVTIVGKILSTSLGPLITGQNLKTSVRVGFGLAQIGEFSFIIATLGLSLKVMSEFLYPVAVAVSLITTFTTPYLIKYAPMVADSLERQLPVRIREFLDKYIAWHQQLATERARGPEFKRLVLKWAVNAFVVIAATFASEQVLVPFATSYVESPEVASTLVWCAAMLVCSPFLWAMLVTFRDYHPQSRRAVSAGTLAQILTLLLVGGLSLVFLQARYVSIAIGVLGLFLFNRLYRQLESSYRWFEDGFLSAFRKEAGDSKTDIYQQLAPWDWHLVRILVNPDSEIAGRRLLDIELRKKYGLNVVAIQRGSQTLVAPKPEQQIFPRDELLVLGTDEQIDAVRTRIESPTGAPEAQAAVAQASLESYEMKRLPVSDGSTLDGKTIRESRIREDFSSLVVGIERHGKRILNPDTDLRLEKGDVLWVVGASPQLSRLALGVGPAPSPNAV